MCHIDLFCCMNDASKVHNFIAEWCKLGIGDVSSIVLDRKEMCLARIDNV